MKKFLAFLLVFTLVFAFSACNNVSDTSSDPASTPASSTPASEEPSSTPAEPSSTPKEEPSSEAEQPSEEPSTDPGPELPAYIPGFIYVSEDSVYTMAPKSPFSIRLTKIDDAPVFGDVVMFTTEYGKTIETAGETFADYAIFVVEYNKDSFKYLKKTIINADDTADKSKIAIPDDGFVVAIHKAQTEMLTALGKVKDNVEIYPSNCQPNKIEYIVKKTDKPLTIDGIFDSEWDDFLVDSVDETNPNWDYRQFEKDNYGIMADIYACYDSENAYFAVVVQSTDCVWMPGATPDSDSGGMWQYNCIQFNMINQSSLSDYMLEHAQYGIDKVAVNEHNVRQYGFCGNDAGQSIAWLYWGSDFSKFTGEVGVKRDIENEQTIYEFTIPWKEMNVDPAKVVDGFEFSFSVSINTSLTTTKWENIRLRNGGGIIGMNEFSKMPVAICME